MEATHSQFKVVANAVFISLPSATQQGYQRDSGIFVATDPNKRMEDNAACIGTVVAIPERLCLVLHEGESNEERVPIDLKPGDKIAVDYRVISQGDWEGEVFKHDNAFLIQDELVWRAQPYSLIAKLTTRDFCPKPDGTGEIQIPHWQALGEHVLLEKITELDPAYKNTTLVLPEILHKEAKGRGTVVSGLDLPMGTEVMFLPQYASTYQFTDGKEYIVVMKDYVFGTLN